MLTLGAGVRRAAGANGAAAGATCSPSCSISDITLSIVSILSRLLRTTRMMIVHVVASMGIRHAMRLQRHANKGFGDHHKGNIDLEPFDAMKLPSLDVSRTRALLGAEPVLDTIVDPTMKVPEDGIKRVRE